MKRILITGSLGLVGSACMELFTKEGWQVIGIDNNNRAKFFGTEKKRVHNWIDADIGSEKMINGIFERNLFDAIIHAAGQPSHDYATGHVLEDFDVNARGTLILLEATRKHCPDATFVYVSTDKVYGENIGGIVGMPEKETRYSPEGLFDKDKYLAREDAGLDYAGDRSLFGCSKAAADIYVQCYAAKFGMKTACFRPGCITGRNHAGAALHGFLAYLAKCVKEGIPYTIHGNGKNVRDNIHANDVASAFYAFIESPSSGAVYNLAGGPERSVSVLEAIKLLEEATGKKAQIAYGPARDSDRLWDCHSVEKFRRAYPTWNYCYSLSDIIADLI